MTTLEDKVYNFKHAMADEGEFFATTGNDEDDYDLIMSVLNRQGYWSGNKYRHYFDDDLNYVTSQLRSEPHVPISK